MAFPSNGDGRVWRSAPHPAVALLVNWLLGLDVTQRALLRDRDFGLLGVADTEHVLLRVRRHLAFDQALDQVLAVHGPSPDRFDRFRRAHSAPHTPTSESRGDGGTQLIRTRH